jgi:adenylosuccinate lyase
MIPRYTPEDIGAVWSEPARIRAWLDVEIAACRAMANAGIVPAADVAALEKTAAEVDVVALADRAEVLEQTTKHDVIAFLSAFEEVAGPPARHVHFGLTSNDVLDTAFALRMGDAGGLVEEALLGLRAALGKQAEAHRRTPMIGRSHGVHAEPISFGLVMASFHAEMTRNVRRLRSAREEMRVGKLSGAVGTNAHLPPAVEREALSALGLEVETVATQVVARDRHAEFFSTLAIVAASIERLAVEIRHLQRTELREAEEPFGKGQKGSSAMPHKRNPILTENVTGLARLMRGWAHAAMENVALWHERDISHSSVERVIAPDATITSVFMLRRMTGVVEGLVVHPQQMQANLDRMRGLPFSQAVLLDLIRKGMDRQPAYEAVQRCAMRVWDEDLDYQSALAGDAVVREHLSAEDVADAFRIERHLHNVDAIIDRALADDP